MEWGPWIQHDGMAVPRIIGEFEYIAEVIPDENGKYRSFWLWYLTPIGTEGRGRILSYRFRKPRGMKVIDEILQGIPEPAVALRGGEVNCFRSETKQPRGNTWG